MTNLLPEGIEPDDEIKISWENDDLGSKIVAALGDATITIETPHDQAVVVPWLVASLPNILEAAWAEIEKDQEPQHG